MKDVTKALPQVVAAYFKAHNTPDRDAFISAFAPDALLNDAQREFLGRDEILAWADKEIFGDHVTVKAQQAFEHRGGYIVHAIYDGDFDKTNLPDPVVLTNYFNVEGDQITQLIILLNKNILAGVENGTVRGSGR
jgi:hypothetical protein